MAKKNVAALNVVKNALRQVEIKDLQVDPSYQRSLVRGHKKIAAEYDPIAFGIPLVAQRDDGSLWIVDGQQRIAALKLRGTHKWVRCEVFASKGPEHEAEVFRQVNKNRTALKPLQLFHALLVAGDEQCWKVKNEVEKRGMAIPKGESHGTAADSESASKQVRCVDALVRILSRGGPEALAFVLDAVSKAWPGDPRRTKYRILDGLYLFWKAMDKTADLNRLIPRLNTTTVTQLLYSAQLGIGSAAANIAEVITKLYHKRIKKGS